MNHNYLIFILLASVFLAVSCAEDEEETDKTRYRDEIFADVDVDEGIVYGQNTTVGGREKTLTMDIYSPSGDDLPQRPAVILVHGGGFIEFASSMGQMEGYARAFARRGYVAANIDYTKYEGTALPIAGQTVWTVAMKARADLLAAIRFLRKDAATAGQYGIDPQRVYALGGSAGAITALHAAYLDTADALPSELAEIISQDGGFSGNSGNPGYSHALSGVINIAGALMDTAFIEAGDCPVISIHGDADEIVPYVAGMAQVPNIVAPTAMQGSALIHQRAQHVGVFSELKTIPGGGHTAALDCEDCESFVYSVLYDWVDAAETP